MLFSVIIPIHNKGPHIHRSISSVLNQTLNDFELILIDDASTDNSLLEIQKFTDPRIRLLPRDIPGPGGYAARNLGIEQAGGVWIAFLDADDEWMPDHLQKLLDLSCTFPECDFLSCGWITKIGSEKFLLDRYSSKKNKITLRKISLKEYLELSILEMRPTCTDVACIRNNLAARKLFPEGKVQRGGDQDAWILYLAKTGHMAWSQHVGAIYHRDAVNMVTKSAPSDPHMIKAIITGLIPYINNDCLQLLPILYNRRLWDAWKVNLLIHPHQLFNLPCNLYWKGDIVFCMSHSVISLIPVFVFRILRYFKKVSSNFIQCYLGKSNIY